MSRIYVPTQKPDDWRPLLAKPEKHWRTGYSAKALAYCWEEAAGFPPEVACLFAESGFPAFRQVEFLMAFPEYQVPLPGGRAPSQSDLFALAKGSDHQLIAMTVEGKVAESFGPSLGQWLYKASPGKKKRLQYIQARLGLAGEIPPSIRYQLLHRTASAVIEAARFNARHAVMLVHSFSSDLLGFDDFQAFLALFQVPVVPNKLVAVGDVDGICIYAGWVQGEARFLAA